MLPAWLAMLLFVSAACGEVIGTVGGVGWPLGAAAVGLHRGRRAIAERHRRLGPRPRAP
jgi:hypothetical protein